MKNFTFLILFSFIINTHVDAQYIWAKQAISDNESTGVDVAIDADGNTFVTGNMDGIINFDAVTAGDIAGNSFEHTYIAKYDPDGNLIWVRTIKGNSNNEMWSVTTDGEGNAYVSGTYSHTNSFTILDFGSIQLEGNLSDSGFLAKVDADGNWEWATPLLSVDELGFQHVKPMVTRIMPGGDILICGYVMGPVSIDGVIYNNVNDSQQKIFFARYNADGEFQWLKHGEGHWGVNTLHPYLKLQLDDAGNSYIHCHTGNSVYEGDTLTHHFGDGFSVVSFDSQATMRWWESVSSSGGETLGGLTLDGDDNVYVAAQKTNILFVGEVQLETSLDYNLWLFKFDNQGNFISASGVYDDFDGFGAARTYDIAWHQDGHILVAGGWETFYDGGPILFGDTLGGGGYRPGFLAAFSTNGTYRDAVAIAFPEGDTDGEFLPNNLAMHTDGHLFLTGKFRNDIDIGDFSLTAGIIKQMFTLKVDISELFDLSTPVREQPGTDQLFRVFPNPASHQLNVQSVRQAGVYRLLDNAGRLVKNFELRAGEGQLQLTDIPSGTYYLRSDEGYSEKIMIVN